MREETKIIINIIDFSPMMEQIKTRYIEQNQDNKEEIEFTIQGQWGFVNTKKGKLMICNEGVVSPKPISPKFPFELDVYKEKKIENGGFMSLLPAYVLNITDPKDIEELPISGQQKLEDFIRVFGGRLESNFHSCKNFLEKIIN
jgi:hypothetical protein